MHQLMLYATSHLSFKSDRATMRPQVAGVAIAILTARQIWNLLRWISMSGDSEKTLIRRLHNMLRHYMNCGRLIRGAFNVRLPYRFFITSGSRCNTIVNYGSYGTVPNHVMQHQKKLQALTEECPDHFFRVALRPLYEESRQIVASEIGCKPENMVFVQNTTEGVNNVLESLLPSFSSTEAVLVSSLGYGAVLKAARYHTRKHNRRIVELSVEFPILSEDQICEMFREAFKSDPNIRMAIVDHIASASAVMLPVQRICEICREFDVISVVDGAHTPGQLVLNLEELQADFYIGNLHKWLFCPKSCAIMRIAERYHTHMQPSLVSHLNHSSMHDRFFKQGTKDMTAPITAGHAVQYMRKLGGVQHMQEYISPLLDSIVGLLTREWNTEELAVPISMRAPYMRVVNLPAIFTQHFGGDAAGGDELILEMFQKHRLACFINTVNGVLCTRVSAQIFSTLHEYKHYAHVIKRYAEQLEGMSANTVLS